MMRKAEAVVPAFEEVNSVDARVAPTGTLENLSQDEVDRLLDTSRGGLYPLYPVSYTHLTLPTILRV